MDLISSLTSRQQAEISTYKQKWQNLIRSNPEPNLTSIKTFVPMLYTLLGKQPPQVGLLPSSIAIGALPQQSSVSRVLDRVGEPIALSLYIGPLLGWLQQRIDKTVWSELQVGLLSLERKSLLYPLPNLLIREFSFRFSNKSNGTLVPVQVTPNINMRSQPPYINWEFVLKLRSEQTQRLEAAPPSHRNWLQSLGEQFFADLDTALKQQLQEFSRQFIQSEFQMQLGRQMQDFVNLFDLLESTEFSVSPEAFGASFLESELYKLWLTVAAFARWNTGIFDGVFLPNTLGGNSLALLDYCVNVLFESKDIDREDSLRALQLARILTNIAESCSVLFCFERVCVVPERLS